MKLQEFTGKCHQQQKSVTKGIGNVLEFGGNSPSECNFSRFSTAIKIPIIICEESNTNSTEKQG
jgi:hypothetical protein